MSLKNFDEQKIVLSVLYSGPSSVLNTPDS